MDARTNGQRMRCLLTLAVGCVVLAMTLVGCRATPVSTPAPAVEMSCDNPVATSLGAPTARRPARLTTSGGRLRFVVRDLPPSSIFGEVEDTEVQLSDPASPTKAVVGVTASPQQPGVVDVDAGTYSVLNTHNGGIEVEVCPGVTLSDVEPAIPDPFEPATPSG